VKANFMFGSEMSPRGQRNEELGTLNQAPIELRDLARLELKRRRLVRELAEISRQHRQVSREIEFKGIAIPWLT
jgi:hypothetical protein